MNYEEGIDYIKNLEGSGRDEIYEDIVINYPGRKGKNDYRLTVQGKAYTHRYIVRELYDLINEGPYTYINLRHLLEDIYANGTNTYYEDINLEYLKHLIYWITLQEDINYPRAPNGTCAGIRLPFTRYYEAIHSTQDGCRFNIEEVEERCDNHGSAKPELYTIENAPNFYRY